ncbi:MAG: PExPT-CTERM protein [Gammaproteobacteria bacterium]
MIKQLVISTLSAGSAVVGLSLAATSGAFAFGGCVNSPENPTWILAGIGGVAAGVPWLRSVIRRRRDKHDK